MNIARRSDCGGGGGGGVGGELVGMGSRVWQKERGRTFRRGRGVEGQFGNLKGERAATEAAMGASESRGKGAWESENKNSDTVLEGERRRGVQYLSRFLKTCLQWVNEWKF